MSKRAYVAAGVAGAVAVVGGIVVGASTGALPGTGHAAGTERARLVSYHGYQAKVPASWPVYDLSKDPTRCVRLDQHAVYLGTPGRDQRCPAHLVGRTEALLVQPLTPAQARQGSGTVSSPGELHRNIPSAKVSVTASYQQNRSLASSLLTVRPKASTPPGPGPTGGAPAPTPSATAASTAPDTTAAPSASSPAAGASGTSAASAAPTGGVTPSGTATDPAATAADPAGTATPAGSATPSDPATPAGSASSPDASPSGTAGPTSADGATPLVTPAGSGAPTPEAITPDATASATVNPPDDDINVGAPSPHPTILRTSTYVVPSALRTSGTRGFDTCAAPSTTAMSAWSSSDLDSIGIYVGGPNRSCDDGNLSASWVQTVHGFGYSFIPVYVGYQAPCTTRTWAKIDPTQAAAEGTAHADEAVADMQKFGLGVGNIVYLDMEQYNATAACTTAVLQYISAFSQRVHQYGYGSGVYGSASAAPHDLGAAYSSSTYTMPDGLFFARYDDVADVNSEPYVSDTLWPDRRIKQYMGPHDEIHGGVTINIDTDYLDGIIALPGTF